MGSPAAGGAGPGAAGDPGRKKPGGRDYADGRGEELAVHAAGAAGAGGTTIVVVPLLSLRQDPQRQLPLRRGSMH